MVVDEFMVCVDRIIATAACFQQESSSSANPVVREREGEPESVSVSVVSENGDETVNKDGVFNGEGSFSGVKAKGSVRECRICQEEDEEKDMEAPCACNGTLKEVYSEMVQQKGDITCEICNQNFSPNYSSPPPRSNADVMAIDIRQAWGPHIDLRDPRFLAFAAAEHQFLQSEYDEYALANSGTLSCFRTVALILMVLLLIRQTLMLTRDFECCENHRFSSIIRFPFFSWLVFFFPAMFWLGHGTFYNAEGGGRVESKSRFRMN